jgi:hypothetical protein
MSSSCLDLHEDERPAVDRHQVELAERHADIGGDNVIAKCLQVIGRKGLAANPEAIGWRRPRPPIRHGFEWK